MKLGVVGGRNFKNKNRLYLELDQLVAIQKAKKNPITEIVSGDCPTGVDKMAKEYAIDRKIKYKGFPAQWDDMAEPCYKKINAQGKAYNALAGFNRNTDIVEYATDVVAFWDGISPGTKDTVDKAKAAKKLLKIYIISDTKFTNK